MTAADFLIYGGIGMLSGFFAGLLGLGGGAIVASMLIVIFSARPEFPESVAARMAIGTTLAIVACTSAPSAAAHARRGGVDWSVARTMTLGAMLGAVLGALLTERAPSYFLKALLALFLFRTAAQMLLPRRPTSLAADDIGGAKLFGASLGIGGLSAMLGIGGGALTVPYLTRRGMPIRFCDWNFGVSRLPPVAVGGAGFHFGRTGRRRFGCSPFMGLCLLAGAVWSCGVQRVLGAAGRGGNRQTPRNHPTPNLRRNEFDFGAPSCRVAVLMSSMSSGIISPQ